MWDKLLLCALTTTLLQCSSSVFPAWKKSLHQMTQTGKPVMVEDFLHACGLDSIPPVYASYYNAKSRLAVIHLEMSEDVWGFELTSVIEKLNETPITDDTLVELLEGESLNIDYSRYGIIDIWHWHRISRTNQIERVYWYFDRPEWHRLIAAAGSAALIPDERTDPDMLKQYYILLLAIAYGWRSSEGIDYPAQREALMNLVNKKEVDLIRLLLRAPSAESRVYAAEALLYLERNGFPIGADDQQRIDQLYADNPVINVRHLKSVTGDPREKIPFREIFTETYVSETVPFMYAHSHGMWMLPDKIVYLFPRDQKP